MPTLDLVPLLDLTAPVVFFPVRHHSPGAARLVRVLIDSLRPRAVLIEGPFDFNDRLDELFLPHRPPLAVYSYVRRPDGLRRGAFYPLCEHSPEWQALHAAKSAGSPIRFIDLPWSAVADREDEPVNRYSDAGLSRSKYIADLCRAVGVDDLHGLWDTLFEQDPDLDLPTYLERCHHLCGHVRLIDGPGKLADRQREAFMARQIRDALAQHGSPVLVVCGGYHVLALHARLNGGGPEGIAEPADIEPQPPVPGEERGISLTPYSFERLDSLTGYEAGMPNPGFYQQVWLDRQAGRSDTHRTLLERIVTGLRDRKQVVSSADLIAAETTASALAALRGHKGIWRTDLIDGLVGAIIKDELSATGTHPLLEVIHDVLRGGERGLLAEGTVLPPLVLDIRKQLTEQRLESRLVPFDLDLELEEAPARARSRVLHRLRILGLPGYEQTAGSDLAARIDLTRIWERWHIVWSPDFDARAIEAARYGPNLAEAAVTCLAEAAEAIQRDAARAALLLLDAALAGLTDLAEALRDRTRELIRTEGDFFGVTAALGHLLYLYRYDTVLETAQSGDIGELLREAYDRGLWLFESLGQVPDRDQDLVAGVTSLRETFERCASLLSLDRAELVDVLRRVGADRAQLPVARGAAIGALWSLGAMDSDNVQQQLGQFADPDRLGDFLTGLFALAREQVQRQRDLVLAIHRVVAGYSDDDFLGALPSLRLAFTVFTPREKHHLALTLREGLGLIEVPVVAALQVDVNTAAAALALEAKILETLTRYGLRGGK